MSTEPAPAVRRFQIIDLMVITTSMAFVFMAYQSVQNAWGEGNWIYYAYQFLTAVASGIFLASFFWLPRQLARTGRIFLHPGHWILGAGAITALGLVGFWIINLAFNVRELNLSNNSSAMQWYALNNFIVAGLQLISLGLLITACFSCTTRWRIPMVLLVLSCFAHAIVNATYGLFMLDLNGSWSFAVTDWIGFFAGGAEMVRYIIMALAAIAVCIAAIVDLRTKTKRDWLHRIGLIAILIDLVLLPLTLYLLLHFAPMNMS